MVGRKSVGFFSQTGIQFLFSFRRDIFQVRPDLLHVLHQAVRLEIKLLQASIQLAVGDSEVDGLLC